jgi:hypothetical protein
MRLEVPSHRKADRKQVKLLGSDEGDETELNY